MSQYISLYRYIVAALVRLQQRDMFNQTAQYYRADLFEGSLCQQVTFIPLKPTDVHGTALNAV